MRELTSAETEHAAGGFGFMAGVVLGVGTSMAGAYAYEKLGGAAGIERLVKAAWDAVVRGATLQAKACQRVPAACMPVGF